MHKGKVKWFNPDTGYGFIELSHGKHDVFVHISAIENIEPHDLHAGTAVEFEIVELRGKKQATRVRKMN